ncbi:hypothetical protein P872_21155 [Rhodonellum psychrophilum GCM71 = DSM 17998]|uniref:Uncharacterized protein n=1 Tax=Rhodonellum psychrophilum GCM71 = DSM 17998 TaxID=1123057 RepID=U5BXX9_9BACT|nr:hypothetical protein P872_21155 [Rhodonellum psychrophilum GCM71 = DSM 17998]
MNASFGFRKNTLFKIKISPWEFEFSGAFWVLTLVMHDHLYSSLKLFRNQSDIPFF